jgi:hypothetical protein
MSRRTDWLLSMAVAVALILVLSFCGCVHVASTPGVPARNATPLEKALVYNDSLAQANKAVALTVINANGTTPPLLSQDQANKILIAQSRIADFDRQLTPLLGTAAGVTANASKIELLLDEIKAAANPLIQSGDLGIKDPKTQQEVLAAFKNVYSFADLVVNMLQQAGLLK